MNNTKSGRSEAEGSDPIYSLIGLTADFVRIEAVSTAPVIKGISYPDLV
jgi:hypothetical protein